MTFLHARQLYYAADAMVVLPAQPGSSVKLAEHTVAAYTTAAAEDWAFGDESGARTALALARLGHEELDGVQEALQPRTGATPR